MWQKLKKLPVVYVSLLLTMGLAFGFGNQTAFAKSLTVTFICTDGSQKLTVKADTKAKAQVVTCTNGSTIDYVNYRNSGVQPLAVQVNCNGDEQVKPSVTGSPTTKNYTFQCIIMGGTATHPTESAASDTPTAKVVPATNVVCADGSLPDKGDVTKCPYVPVTADPASTSGNCSDINNCDLINKYINPFINFLAALVGVVVVVSIIMGAIMYGSSGGDPGKVTAAKERIRNAILALVAFLFLYTGLNFLIPGGLL
jgi:hypothetical protein